MSLEEWGITNRVARCVSTLQPQILPWPLFWCLYNYRTEAWKNVALIGMSPSYSRVGCWGSIRTDKWCIYWLCINDLGFRKHWKDIYQKNLKPASTRDLALVASAREDIR